MADGLNQCTFIGNLGADPETRHTADGRAVTNFRIGCSESWKDKQTGDRRERTEWVRVATFDRLAEVCAEYLTIGRQVLIQGRMETQKYEANDGSTRYATQIVANRMLMLGSGGRSSGGGSESPSRPDSTPKARPRPQESPAAGGDFDDDIPF